MRAREGASLLGVEEVPRDQTQSYGIVTIDKMVDDLARIHSIVEKPKPAAAPSNLAVIGRYVLTPRIFELLRRWSSSDCAIPRRARPSRAT